MKHAHSAIFTTLRLLMLALACATTAAHADEYGEVNQLLRSGKLSEALIKAEVYLAVKPRDPQMRFFKGVIQHSSGKLSDAITTFIKLTEDYPELPEPYNNLAVLYADQSQFDKARAALEMAIRTNPSYATAHENLGDVYTRLASHAYNKALQIDGANAVVPPKLALIRELFKPKGMGQSSASTVPVTASVVATTPVAKPASAASSAVAVAPAATASSSAALAKPAGSDGTGKDVKEVEAVVRAWAKAWSAKDLPTYLSAYGKEFTPSTKQSRSAWEAERRQRIAGKSSISVKLENLTITVNGNRSVVKFRQNYRADALAVSSRKTLDLLKTGERWKIVRESTAN